MSGERVLCVIPARGGSKGVPQKNLRPVGGKPLLAWVCDVARQVPLIDCTVLSTDDAEMAAVARSHGVEVPFLRDSALSRDETPVIEVVRDALTRMEAARGIVFDWILLLQPTCPFVQPHDIGRALELARSRAADTVLAVYPVGQKHPDIMLTLDSQSEVRWFTAPENRMARRQDLAPLLARSGLLYLANRRTILERGSFYGDRVCAIEVEAARTLGIDTEEDLALAEVLAPRYASEGPGAQSSPVADGSKAAFDESWRTRKETRYRHWTHGEPQNQIQLAFRNHWTLFSELLGTSDGHGRACLEVGCGRGSLSCYFADAGYDCHLLDSSQEIVAQAGALFGELGFRGHFEAGDALALPYAADRFDVVFSIGLLEHFDDIATPIREQLRVLKPGGTLFLYVVPEKHVAAQDREQWINDLLLAATGAKATVGGKLPVHRTTYPAADYLRCLEALSARGAQASGVYPLPMISFSPQFPFTLLPEPAEEILVREFQRRLAARREETGRHPWLCSEEEGQAFLVWCSK